jgi:hypothetical protein
MKRTFSLLFLACFLLTACNSAPPTTAPVPFIVQYTAATVPWLASLYNCAGTNVIAADQRAADFIDPQSVDLAIRIGQPDTMNSPAYQIGSEDILVIVNLQNLVQTLTTEQVHGLFSGQTLNWQGVGGSNAPVQVWVFSTGEDIEQIFEQTALSGIPIVSTARLAANPDEMAQAIASDANAIGVLTRRLMREDVTSAYTVATVPVLAITSTLPQSPVRGIVACLQK